MLKDFEFVNLYCTASPEVQEAVKRILELNETEQHAEKVRQILIDCKVAPDLIEYWDSIQATA